MKKVFETRVWTMVIAMISVLMSVTACSLDSGEPEKPFTTDPVEGATKLYVCGIGSPETKAADNILFTEHEIEWFDVNTRELCFSGMEIPLKERLSLLSGVEFRLADSVLFTGSTFVGLECSQVFDDLVLCYGKMDGEVVDDGKYYLYDCYPLQYIEDERVQANRTRRASQWKTFLNYLEKAGKLKK